MVRKRCVLSALFIPFIFTVALLATPDMYAQVFIPDTSKVVIGDLKGKSAITIVSKVYVSEDWTSDGAGEIWLAGFAPDLDQLENGIGIVWSEIMTGWFSSWKIQLQNSPQNSARLDLATLKPRAGHTYTTIISYDIAQESGSILITDDVENTVVYSGGFDSAVNITNMYAISGLVVSDVQEEHPNIENVQLDVYDAYVPVATTLHLVTKDAPNFSVTAVERNEETLFKFVVPGAAGDGEYRISLYHHDTDRHQLIKTTTTSEREVRIPVSLTDFPGRVTISLSYVHDGHTWFDRELEVNAGWLRVHAVDMRLDWENRQVHMNLVIESDGPIVDLPVSINSIFQFATRDNDTKLLETHQYNPIEVFNDVINIVSSSTRIPLTSTIPQAGLPGLWKLDLTFDPDSTVNVRKFSTEMFFKSPATMVRETSSRMKPKLPEINSGITPEEELILREQAINRQRRILYNNDGGDSRVPSSPQTIRSFLSTRTTPLLDSHVDTIIYDTTAGSFGLFAHATEVGEVFLTRAGRYQYNMTPDLIFNHQTDPLQVMIDFAREHEYEFFWTMRMNDTHDASNDLLMPDFKRKHPELLFGTNTHRPPHGAWSGVDYGQACIRKLAFRFVEEVALNYDVDGIMLDFFRHPVFFKKAAWGQPVGPDELDLMTDLIRKIRTRLEEISAVKEKVILLAVRIPDSVAYNLDIGIDIERWLSDGLIDLVMPSGYFRLSPWDDFVQLGHRYGVPVYPSLDESRVIEDPGFVPDRNSLQSYRARAMNIWQSGADGIHMFNMFTPSHPMLREIGSIETLLGKEKAYYVSVRGDSGSANPHRFVGGETNYFNYNVVTPDSPKALWGGSPITFHLEVGEDIPAAVQAGFHPEVTLRVVFSGGYDEGGLTASINGHPLGQPTREETYLHYMVNPEWLVSGSNRLEFDVQEGSGLAQTFHSTLPSTGSRIVITKLDVTTPDKHSLGISVSAQAIGDAMIGSVSVRTPNPSHTMPVPPGFERASNGYAYPIGLPSPGYTFNGPHDEDPSDGTFRITLPMRDGTPGVYTVQVIVQNRPHAGAYFSDHQTVVFRVNDEGEVQLPRVVNDVQLHVQYDHK